MSTGTIEEQAVLDLVVKHLGYQVNSLETLIWNGEHHPSYAPQSMVRQSGHRLKGAIELAVRTAGGVTRSLPNEVLNRANDVADKAISFKRV